MGWRKREERGVEEKKMLVVRDEGAERERERERVTFDFVIGKKNLKSYFLLEKN